MPIVDLRNTPTVVEVGPGATVAEFTDEQITAEVMVGPTVVEFSWGELVPGPGLRGGGPFTGTVFIDQDIPSLPPGLEPLDSNLDLVMVWDESRQEHVKRPAQFASQIEFATVPEAEAAIIDDKAIAPDVAGIVYDRLHHMGQHTAGKGTATVNLSPDSGVVVVNGALSNVFRLVMTGDVTFANPINPVNGQTVNIHIKQNVFGGHEITGWGSQWKFVNKINPVLSTDPNAIDLLSCQWNEVDGIMECSFLPNYGSGFVAPVPPTAADLIFTNVGGGNNIYKDTTALNVNLRTLIGSGDISVSTVEDTIVISYTAPLAVDYSAVPFLISGDVADFPSLPYARTIVAGYGIAIDTTTEGSFILSSDLVAVPLGGTTTQVLSKLSDTDYDFAWVDLPETGGATFPPGGTTGQALVKLSGADSDVGWGTVSGGGGGSITITAANPTFFKMKAADESRTNNTTLSNDADLQVVLEAGKKYVIHLHVLFLQPATEDFKADLNYTGTLADFKAWYERMGLTGEQSLLTRRDISLNTTLSWTFTSNQDGVANFIITLETSSAGTFSFRFAQNTSGATSSIVKRGSYIRAEQVFDGWGGSISGALVSRLALQTFNTTAAFVSWDTEIRDDENYWSNLNPTRITIPTAGWYTITGTVIQAGDPDDMQTLAWIKNGAAFSSTQHQTRLGAGSTAVATSSQIIETGYFAAGDYLELRVANRSGTSTAYAQCSILRHGGATGPTGQQGPSGNVSFDRLLVQKNDFVLTNNATYTDTDVKITLTPGTYLIEGESAITSSASPGSLIRLNFTGTTTWATLRRWGGQVGNVGSAVDFAFPSVTGNQSYNGEGAHRWSGICVVSVAGDLALQFRQNVSGASPITFRRGSFLSVREISGEITTIDTEIAADNPRGYWKLDEASGNFADSSGNGHTLTITGTPIQQYQFSAVDGRNPTRKTPISTAGGQSNYAGNATALGVTLPITTYTMEVWGRWTTAGMLMAIGSAGETTATNFSGQMLIVASGGGQLEQFWEYSSGTNGPTITSLLGGILDGKLHHLVSVKDAATLSVKYYVDGQYVGGGTYTGGQEHTGGTSNVFSIIGTPGDATSAADGQYSGAAFYTTVLSEARIQAHARALGVFK